MSGSPSSPAISTQLVLPPTSAVCGPAAAMLPRTPQNLIRIMFMPSATAKEQAPGQPRSHAVPPLWRRRQRSITDQLHHFGSALQDRYGAGARRLGIEQKVHHRRLDAVALDILARLRLRG